MPSVLSVAAGVATAAAAAVAAKLLADRLRETSDEPLGLHPTQYRPVALQETVWVAEGVLLLVFRVPGGRALDLPAGKHVQLAFDDADGERVSRSYTPTESRIAGRFDLLVKVYPGGRMGEKLASLKPGDTVLARGPTGRLAYGPGKFTLGKAVTPCRHILMLAGGTGITPMAQIVKAVLQDAQRDRTKLLLLYASSRPEDVLLYHELCALATVHRGQFKLVFTVSKASEAWRARAKDPHSAAAHVEGRMSAALVRAHAPAFLGQRPFPEWAVAGYCGPPAFEECAKGVLESLGFASAGMVNLFRW